MKDQKSTYIAPQLIVQYFDSQCICSTSAYDVAEGDFFGRNPFEE